MGERERQAVQILQQSALSREGIWSSLGHALAMDAASVRRTQQEDREESIDQQDIFHRVIFFLAAITFRLCRRVLRADETPFRLVMGTRGDAGMPAGAAVRGAGASSSGTTTVAASASAMPQRCARAVRERAGASPRARSAARRAGRRT